MSNKFQKKIYLLKVLILSLLLTFTTVFSFAQGYEIGVPFYKNISPKEYGFESQNFSITQDSTGRIFIGNLNGILIFDGFHWDFIPIKGVPYFTKNDIGEIFVGGFKQFGKIENKFYGRYSLRQLTDSSKDIIEDQIDKLASFGKEIFFKTKNNIFKYSEKNGFTKINFSGSYVNLFKAKDKLFFVNDTNLYTYQKDNLKQITLPHAVENDFVLDILPYDKNKFLFRFYNNGFYIYNEKSNHFSSFPSSLNNTILPENYVKTIPISNDVFVLGTQDNGIIFFDKKGQVISSFDQNNGLINNNVTDLFIDRNKNLWVLTNYGFCIIQTDFQFTFFGPSSGLDGGLSDIIRFNNHLYVSSLQGTYLLSDTCFFDNTTKCFDHDRFHRIPGLDIQTENFLYFKNHLLHSTTAGIFDISGKKAKKLSNETSRGIYAIQKDSDLLLTTGINGVSIFRFSDGNLSYQGNFTNCHSSIRTFAEDGNTFWFGSDHQGLFKITVTDSINFDAPFVSLNNAKGLPSEFNWIDVYRTSNGTIFSTDKGVYRYDNKTKSFYQDTLLGLDFSSGEVWVFPLLEDKNKNLWFSSGTKGKYEKHTFFAKFNSKDKSYQLISYPLNKINDQSIEDIYIDSNKIAWFGTMKNLIRFDFSEIDKCQDTLPPQILIHAIIIGKDSLLLLPTDFLNNPEKLLKIDYSLRDIHFELSTPEYSSATIEFNYFLEGYNKKFSGWENKNFKEYTNLSPGEYILHVKARTSTKANEGEIIIPFSIVAPYYLTIVAYIFYLALLASLILLIVYWRSYLSEKEKFKVQQLLSQRTEELVYQKERAEELLSKILPEDTARQIQKKGKADRKSFKMVTVLFADIKGFTKIAENTPPEELLDELDTLFLKFDSSVEEMGIEKIKTIGDAYMCAGGIPMKNRTNPIDVILSGMKMLEYLQETNRISKTKWQIRIGVHTGPVIAGVIGTRKISYDIWGDTVNVASRMESMGKAGEINISESTYELVEKYFECVPRGMIPVKYKGNISMYFVKGLKPKYAADDEGKVPNDAFYFQLQHIRFSDLEELILTKLEKGLPKNQYYHNMKHTIDVINQAELIARGENCTDEEILILKTAALFHDSGFIISYDDHEEQGIKLAKEILPQFKYTQKQIQLIGELIYATKFPPNPKTKLQKIICDSDLDYLGREDFVPVSNELFKELSVRGKVKSIEEWNNIQIKFLQSHQYYTETARNIRRVNKLKQLEKLKESMKDNK